MKRFITLFSLLMIVMVLAACGGDDAGTDSGEAASDGDNAAAEGGDPDAPLELAEDEYYVIQATGAIDSTFRSTSWGGESPNRRFMDTGDWWTLVMGATNRVDEQEVSMIQLYILKDLEPGEYDISGGSILDTPDAENPVKLINANVRYPDFQILNDDEEISGTLTIDSLSDEGISGTINLTLMGEGGDIEATAVFDVPVVEVLE